MASNLTRFPHLSGVMAHLESPEAGKGLCFHRSAGLCMDLLGSDVVMGTFRAATPEERASIPHASNIPFIHCWVEIEDAVLAPTLIEKMGMALRPMRRDAYYEVNGARDIYRLPRADMLRATVGMGLSAYLKGRSPLADPRPLGDILMTAAGLPYALTDWGTAVPPDTAPEDLRRE